MEIDGWTTSDGGQKRPPYRSLLPPRETPSREELIEAGLREQTALSTKVGSAETFVSFDDFVVERIDSPLYVAIRGRALICLRLSATHIANLDPILVALRQYPPELLMAAYLGGDYPILRSVLRLPDSETYQCFESPLLLGQGDVQEFCIALLESRKVELHLTHNDDQRIVPLEFDAPGGDNVVSRAMDQIRQVPYPTGGDPGPTLDRMYAAFPDFTDGFTSRDLIPLTNMRKTSHAVRIRLTF